MLGIDTIGLFFDGPWPAALMQAAAALAGSADSGVYPNSGPVLSK